MNLWAQPCAQQPRRCAGGEERKRRNGTYVLSPSTQRGVCHCAGLHGSVPGSGCRAAIDAEQARIAALQDAQQQRVIAQLLAERALLDDGQRARLMALLLSRYAQESSEEELLHRD